MLRSAPVETGARLEARLLFMQSAVGEKPTFMSSVPAGEVTI
jgi:hypothetical protein